MEIRTERPGDDLRIRELHARAFADPDQVGSIPVESRLVDDLRRGDSWLPFLSLVAVVDEDVAGHLTCTRAHVEEEPVLALGPIGVDPPLQGQGIGAELMRHAVDRADSLGEPLVGLVGDPAWYARFGFLAASTFSILAPHPDWGDYFQICPLTQYQQTITGRFVFANEFRVT